MQKQLAAQMNQNYFQTASTDFITALPPPLLQSHRLQPVLQRTASHDQSHVGNGGGGALGLRMCAFL